MLSRYQLCASTVAAVFLSHYIVSFGAGKRFQCFCGFFTLSTLIAAAYNFLIRQSISPLRHLPTATQAPLWKRLFKEPTPWLFEKWMKEVPNNGLIRYFGILNQERLLLTSPAGVREVLGAKTYDFHKQRAQKIHLEPVLGRGLVFVEGDTHKFHRKQLSPAFSTKAVRGFQAILTRKTLEVMNIFQKDIFRQCQAKCDTGTKPQLSGIVEVHEPVSRAALDIIGLAGCSFNFNSLGEGSSNLQMIRDYRKAFGVSPSNRIRCLLAHVLPAWFVDHAPLRRNRDIAVVTRIVTRLAQEMVRAKRLVMSKKPNPDILDRTIQSGGFSDEVLFEQVKTLLAAGHDTTSSTLASVAAVLSQPIYHHIQQKMRSEIRERLPSLKSFENVSPMEIESLSYLNAVRNEILRLYPPFSWFFRRSVVDTVICGQEIPKYTDIILCPWGMHRSTEFWGPDAEEFNPDRWLKDPNGRGGAHDSTSFITFGAGPRVCIAERFAQNEISTLMTGIFGRFRVEQAEGISESPLSHQLTLTRIGGVKVRMTPLEDW